MFGAMCCRNRSECTFRNPAIVFFVSLGYLLLVTSQLAVTVPLHDHSLGHSSSSFTDESYGKNTQLNITIDLTFDTPSNDEIKLDQWVCLDNYLRLGEEWFNIPSTWSRSVLAEQRDNCTCFLNGHCGGGGGNTTPELDQQQHRKPSLWLRCYHEHKAQSRLPPLQPLVELLLSPEKQTQLAATHLDYLAECLPVTDDQSIALRVDFVGTNGSLESLFEILNQFNSHPSIRLETISLRLLHLKSIPDFERFTNLKTLNLSENELTQFDSRQTPSLKRIVTLDLSRNKVSRIDLTQLPALNWISLAHNSLTSLAITDLSSEQYAWLKQLQTGPMEKLPWYFNLGNNPWHCNESLSWLIDEISAIAEVNWHIFDTGQKMELYRNNEPECALPVEAEMYPFSVLKSVRQSAICRQCRCYLKERYSTMGYRYGVVNCTGQGLTQVPIEMPKYTKMIDLSNNRISSVNPLSRVRNLWPNVHFIDLQNNSIETLDGLDQVRTITSLDVSGNLLIEIPYHILDQVLSSKMVDKLHLGNNPFTCDCNTVKMQKWLQSNYRIIMDIGRVRCGYMRTELAQNESNLALLQTYSDEFYNREILKINNLELCPSIASVEFFDILNCILAFSIIFLLVKVTYDYFWQKRTGKLPHFFKLNY